MAGRNQRKSIPKKLERDLAAIPKYRRESKKSPMLPTESPEDPFSFERKLMDDVLGGAKRYAKRNNSDSDAAFAPSSMPDNTDLLGKMANRLKIVEGKYARAKEELGRRAGEIEILKLQNEELSKTHEVGMVQRVQELSAENAQLSGQIKEMEDFLAEYGLKWVGKSSQDPQIQKSKGVLPRSGLPPRNTGVSPSSDSGNTSSKANPPSCLFDIDSVLQKIKELNILVTEGKGKRVDHQGARAQLKNHESIPLTFFLDGLLVKNGPIRTYQDPRTKAFLKDIMEGFFPAEFESQYPKGIVLDAHDRRQEEYQAAVNAEREASKANGRFKGLADIGGADLNMNVDSFLNRLPASVVKDGKIVSIREDIENRIKGAGAEGEPLVERAVVSAPPEAGQDGSGPARSTRVQVRSPSGKEVLVATLRYQDTIAVLKQVIQEKWEDLHNFEVRTAFPPKIFSDTSQTLEDAGLVPNASMLVKLV
eukprot:CAMPEP_0117734296 /NCGR_PEP_ID=MMETSP0947-20121206/580_1 /TAXON_ID=44440 /ORGANISM="Chattonella subsalsa, Strain CCMP2191" /LENGTH=477 /DNA_ID=CAMNT_0005549029 /DNA_START=60 /DNA_END=1493 /DNA_ORIENTATION=+